MKLVVHIGIDIEPTDRAPESRLALTVLGPVLDTAIYNALIDRPLTNLHGACAIRGVSIRLEDA